MAFDMASENADTLAEEDENYGRYEDAVKHYVEAISCTKQALSLESDRPECLQHYDEYYLRMLIHQHAIVKTSDQIQHGFTQEMCKTLVEMQRQISCLVEHRQQYKPDIEAFEKIRCFTQAKLQAYKAAHPEYFETEADASITIELIEDDQHDAVTPVESPATAPVDNLAAAGSCPVAPASDSPSVEG
jgi:tetratricopeptide (TPR) repeat protein